MTRAVLITGGARRIGRHLAIDLAKVGYDIILHHGHSDQAADEIAGQIRGLGRFVYILKIDLQEPEKILIGLTGIPEELEIFALVNNAAIYKPLEFSDTSLEIWEDHIRVNLTAPFILSKWFFSRLKPETHGRIINLLDWRALRPGKDHFPYTITKAALASMTQSLALSMAPRVTVNGIAFGAILPPSDGSSAEKMLQNVPAERIAELDEVTQTIRFLLEGPEYITGEIIHLDGGRHLI
jgi:NAD(P)-dependent dehydrogenase (short-subunit alcohol dehydrogenase family)